MVNAERTILKTIKRRKLGYFERLKLIIRGKILEKRGLERKNISCWWMRMERRWRSDILGHLWWHTYILDNFCNDSKVPYSTVGVPLPATEPFPLPNFILFDSWRVAKKYPNKFFTREKKARESESERVERRKKNRTRKSYSLLSFFYYTNE